jgi:hypothetical protein
VLGDQFDRGAVYDWIALREVSHGFYEQPLPIYVTWIGHAFSFSSAAQLGGDWNGEHFGHA